MSLRVEGSGTGCEWKTEAVQSSFTSFERERQKGYSLHGYVKVCLWLYSPWCQSQLVFILGVLFSKGWRSYSPRRQSPFFPSKPFIPEAAGISQCSETKVVGGQEPSKLLSRRMEIIHFLIFPSHCMYSILLSSSFFQGVSETRVSSIHIDTPK